MRVSGWLYLLWQTLCSACLLSAVGLSAGLKPQRWRILLLSPMLSAITMAAQALPAPGRMLLLLPCAAFSPLLAFPDCPRRLHLRMAAMGVGLSLWLTGVMRFLAPLALPGGLLLLLGCAAVSLPPGLRARAGDAPRCTSVLLRVGPRQTTLTALVDSGNLLRDAVTGLPVIVISRRAAAKLLTLPPAGTLLPGMRLMSVRTISGTALMTVLRPDAVRVLSGGQWQDVRALIGLSPDGYEGFQALLPSCLVSADQPALPRNAISQ
ncbi:MAG: sigma-E processing peptidase SpoIIGA [Clostridia bacterium]|nr:sigma-E processing peptidase SpoIIGA [Clostridia bacterium]